MYRYEHDLYKGVFYLGLARLYERTKDELLSEIIENSYSAMLSRVMIFLLNY